MILSMTGYGRKEESDGERRLTIEVRSLNNRFLDIVVKLPRSLSVLEQKVKRTVQDRFSRGRFEIFVTRSGDQEQTGKITINEKIAAEYVAALRNLKSNFGLAGDVDFRFVAGLPDVVTIAMDQENPETVWNLLSQGLTGALDDLSRMRREEGAALNADITARLKDIQSLAAKVAISAPASVELARKRITEAVAKLMKEQPDPARISQEIAILAEREDISEELTRLTSHIGQFRSIMGEASREGVGENLFLIQEMGREANTVASKRWMRKYLSISSGSRRNLKRSGNKRRISNSRTVRPIQ